MFSLNEKVVYPGHGVAEIVRIVEKVVAGHRMSYYELKFLNNDMTVLVPVEGASEAAIRPISSRKSVQDALGVLSQPVRRLSSYEFTASCWNKRNKEYQIKLRTGGLRELSEIYRDLYSMGTQKELSFGEKNLLQQAELLLAEEISLVERLERDRAVQYLRSLCLKPYKTCSITPQTPGQVL